MINSEFKILVHKRNKLVFKCKAIPKHYFNFLIGSNNTNECCIDSNHISKQHAQLIFSKDGLFIQDLNSTNGTFVNGQKLIPNNLIKISLNDKVQLSSIDEIRLSLTVDNFADTKFKSDKNILSVLTYKKSISIGRQESCDIVIPHKSVSRNHAELVKTNDNKIYLVDLNSLNGTYVNGRKIHGKFQINESDNIFIGNYKLNLKKGVQNLEDEFSVYTEGIVKEYDNGFIGLNKTDLAIPSGKLVAIMGPSGCGKSTLLKALNGDSPATEGKVFLFNLELNSNFNYLKSKIGYVPQDDIIHRELTVRQCLYYSGKLRLDGYSDEDINQKIKEVLDRLKISKIIDHKISKISGGQRKRVSIAVELLTDPLLLFLDEPTSPLDPYVIGEFLNILKDLASRGTTVVMVTHKPEDLQYMDEVIFMTKGGHLAYHGGSNNFCDYFGISDTIEVYKILETPRRCNEFVNRMKSRSISTDSNSSPESVVNKSEISPLSQLYWLSKRYFKIKTQDKNNFIMMLVQAPIIAILVCFIFSDITASVPFITCIAAIWFGTNNAAKEIVSEKTIYKRERMFNLSISPYLFSKISILFLFSCFQSAVFVTILHLNFNVFEFNDNIISLNNPLSYFIWMSVISLVSTIFGLLISSMTQNSEQVMTVVPILLIPQIMLAGLIVKIENSFIENISYLTISRWGTEGFNLIQENILVITSYLTSDNVFNHIEESKSSRDVLLNQFHSTYRDIENHGTLELDSFVLIIMTLIFIGGIWYKLKKMDPLKI